MRCWTCSLRAIPVPIVQNALTQGCGWKGATSQGFLREGPRKLKLPDTRRTGLLCTRPSCGPIAVMRLDWKLRWGLASCCCRSC